MRHHNIHRRDCADTSAWPPLQRRPSRPVSNTAPGVGTQPTPPADGHLPALVRAALRTRRRQRFRALGARPGLKRHDGESGHGGPPRLRISQCTPAHAGLMNGRRKISLRVSAVCDAQRPTAAPPSPPPPQSQGLPSGRRCSGRCNPPEVPTASPPPPTLQPRPVSSGH